MYSANEGALSFDYQEIDSPISSNQATTLMKSENHYEVEHTYEFTRTTSSAEVSYYAEVGPLQEVSLIDLLLKKYTYIQLCKQIAIVFLCTPLYMKLETSFNYHALLMLRVPRLDIVDLCS